jgi:HAMP domain-containing protein
MSTTGRATLRTSIIYAGALLIFLPFFAAAGLYSRELSQRGQEQISSRLAGRATAAADQLAQRLHELWLDVSGLSSVPFDDLDRTRGDLTLLSRLGSRFTWIGVTDVEGKVLVSSQRMLEGASVAQRPWFRQGMEGPVAVDVHEAQLLAKLLPNPASEPFRFIDLAAPVKDADGRVRGVVGAHVNWNWVQTTLTRLQSPGTELLLVSRDGRVLFGPPDLQDKQVQTTALSAAQQGTTATRIERWPDGRDYITATVGTIGYADLPSFGWSLVVRQDLAAATKVVGDLTWSFWKTLGTGLVLAFLVLCLFAGWVSRPMRRLADFAERLGDGEPAGFPHQETRYDEAARLSAGLTRIQARLPQTRADATLDRAA